MRKVLAIFVICFACIAGISAHSDDETDIARSARKNSSNIVSVGARQKLDNSTVNTRSSGTNSLKINATSSSGLNNRERTAVSPRTETTATESRSGKKTVSARTAVNVQTRNLNNNAKVSERSVRSTTAKPTNLSRSAVRSARTNSKSVKYSRAAADTTPVAGVTNNSVNSENSSANPVVADYTKCKKVYYDCMDEFCANKDTQLKRCACSARMNDFDNIKQILSSAEDKVLDFNERLLSVNMEAEDAAAMSQATEGETAYQQDDESSSKKMLNEISNKLDSETSSSGKDNLTLTLDTNAAFDNLDSTSGASTVTKEGQDLYNAALPICREMAMEVCDETSAEIVESGYQMAIEQDCNTVQKAYDNIESEALKKVQEGSSLLDMSRLDIYQKRNSDDTLTCRKKMLETIYNTSVCGENLTSCLDITGKYINPTTGEAFLTENLADLSTVLIRPTGNQTWTTVSNNKNFVEFLESKKPYLESSTENCQDIAPSIWDDFMEDALAQIKLAQVKKLEAMRESCTTLTTECLTNANASISDFDARALSIFGVAADKTVNEMCVKIKNACTALLNTDTSEDETWVAGMTEIQTQITYDSIIDTCREVGKACVIEQCTSISGNFGLCDEIEGSVNRKAVVSLTSDCWNEVLDCVKDADSDSIENIMAYFGKDDPDPTKNSFYAETYGSYTFTPTNTNDSLACTGNNKCIYDICANACQNTSFLSDNCRACRIAEKIWGNCEYTPTHDLSVKDSHNIIIPAKDDDNETLLEWFAASTDTEDITYNCASTDCGAGYIAKTNTDGTVSCTDSSFVTSANETDCDSAKFFYINSSYSNCCKSGKTDNFGNCCADGNIIVSSIANMYDPATPGLPGSYFTETSQSFSPFKICAPESIGKDPLKNATLVAAFSIDTATATPDYSNTYAPGINYLICLGTVSLSVTGTDINTTPYPAGQTVVCNGKYIVINANSGTYMDPTGTNYVKNSYKTPAGTCTLNPSGTAYASWWNNACLSSTISDYPTNISNNLMIDY